MNKNINYLNKAHTPMVKNLDKASFTNKKKENELSATNGMFNTNTQINKSRNLSFNQHHVKFQKTSSKPHLLSPIMDGKAKPTPGVQRLYFSLGNSNNTGNNNYESFEKHIDEQIYHRKINDKSQLLNNRQNFQSNTSVESSSNNISDSSEDIRKKLAEFQKKVKNEAKQNKIEEIQIKRAVLNDKTQESGQIHLLQESSDEQEMLSSESFILNRVENSQTLFDLISFLKIYLKKLENNYSLDDLYTFLKTNMQAGYRNLTVEYLEKYSKNKYTSLGVYNNSETIDAQLNANKTPVRRSLSQLKQSHNQMFANITKPLHKSPVKPVQKLLEYLKIFKIIFHIVQRDLIVGIFQNKLLFSETEHIFLAQRPKSKSMSDIYSNDGSSEYRLRMIEKVKKYHEILYELNEKLLILINDHKQEDLKLLSPHSNLQPKYLYFKQGEYVLRLTTDIICKFQMVLNICQTVYYLHAKLKENDFRGSTVYSKLEGYSEHCEYDQEFTFYSCPKIELKKQYAVLKLLPRKKIHAFQKLPKLINETTPKKSLINPSKSVMKKINPNALDIEKYTERINSNLNKQQKIIIEKKRQPIKSQKSEDEMRNERETLIAMLKLRLDSSDSIIRETDSGSIASDNDSIFCLDDDDSDIVPTTIKVVFNSNEKNSF